MDIKNSFFISPKILSNCPDLKIYLIEGTIDNSGGERTQVLLDDIMQDDQYYDTRSESIVATRSAYKSLGKEPSRYRPSAEALRRRIKSMKGLYQISPAVDIINYISIKSGISIGGYDLEKILPPIKLNIGGKQPYDAVGRGALNIEFLPCLYDSDGPFGSPTSDSSRTMITPHTKKLLMVFFDFLGNELNSKYVDEAEKLLEKYCNFSSDFTGII